MRLRKNAAALAVGLVVCVTGGPAAAAAASEAGLADVVCHGTQEVRYTPGLTLRPAPQTVSVTTTYAQCTGLSRPDITSGSSFVETDVPSRSCLSPLDSDTITSTVTWNTGETSVFVADRTVTDIAASVVVTYNGFVIDGTFDGDRIVQVIVYPTINVLDCALTTLRHREGVTTATFTGV